MSVSALLFVQTPLSTPFQPPPVPRGETRASPSTSRTATSTGRAADPVTSPRSEGSSPTSGRSAREAHQGLEDFRGQGRPALGDEFQNPGHEAHDGVSGSKRTFGQQRELAPFALPPGNPLLLGAHTGANTPARPLEALQRCGTPGVSQELHTQALQALGLLSGPGNSLLDDIGPKALRALGFFLDAPRR